MNDGPQNPGQPDPEEMAEQLRRMMQQLGLPVSGDLTSFMTQLSQMFGSGSSVGFGMPGTNPSDGPVDWSHIKDMARHITASHGPDPAQVSRNAQLYSMRPGLQRAGSTANASSLR